MPTTPQTNQTFEAYLDGSSISVGLVDATLPNIQPLTAEMKGPGIIGAIDQPIVGSVQSMTTTLNFRTVTNDSSKLMVPSQLHIELWASVQTVNPSTGQYESKQHKVIMRGTLKNLTLGAFNIGEIQGRNLEYEVSYFREFWDNKQTVEIDKWNNKFVVNGVDVLSDIKKATGLA